MKEKFQKNEYNGTLPLYDGGCEFELFKDICIRILSKTKLANKIKYIENDENGKIIIHTIFTKERKK